MNIIDYNAYTFNRQCHDIMIDDGVCTIYSSGRHRDKPASKVQTSCDETTISEGFNAHSIKLPNGCVINVHENGEIYLREDGGQAKKIRNKDSLQKLLVK